MTTNIKKSPNMNGAPKKSSHNNGLSSVLQSTNLQVDNEKMDGVTLSGNDHSECYDSGEKDLDGDVVFIDDIFVEMCEGTLTINTELQIKDYFNILRVLFTIKEKMEVDDNGQKDNELREDAMEENGKGRKRLAEEIKVQVETNCTGTTEESEEGMEKASLEINQPNNIDQNEREEQHNASVEGKNNNSNKIEKKLSESSSNLQVVVNKEEIIEECNVQLKRKGRQDKAVSVEDNHQIIEDRENSLKSSLYNNATDLLLRLQSASSNHRNNLASVNAVRNVLQESTVGSEKENYKLSLLREK